MNRPARWWKLGLFALTLGACEQQPLTHPFVPRQPSPAPSAQGGGSPGQRMLQGPTAAAQAEGAGEATIQLDDFLAEGDRLGVFVEPPADACFLAVARGSEGVDDLDLLAFNDEGSPLAVDEAQDASPALLLCPPHPGRIYLMIRGMTGRGRVALSTQPVLLGVALRVGKALNARGRPGASGRETEVWPGLDEKVAQMRRTVGGQWREIRRVALPAEARSPGYLTETIEAGRCLLWMATPSEETTEIDTQLLDSEGRIVGRASELGRERVGVVCSSSPTTSGIELRPRIGGGVIAVVIARSVPGTEADISLRPERLDLAPTGTPEASFTQATQRLKAAGYGPAMARVQGQARTGQLSSFPLRLGPGCARIDLAGGTPLLGLSASLWTEQGTLLARGEGGASATLFACGTGGAARLEVEAQHRPGPFLAEVRQEPPAALPQELAAGRLLARFNTPGEIVRPSALNTPQYQPIATTKAVQLNQKLPANQCIEVGAALGEGGSGLELRVFEASSREELGRGSAGHATIVPVCAPERALDLQVEVRLLAGQTSVLTAVRSVPRR